MQANPRLVGAIVGAAVGAVVGHLWFTQGGRRTVDRARHLIEQLSTEFKNAGGLAGEFVDEARRWQPLIHRLRDAVGNFQAALHPNGHTRSERTWQGGLQ